jgi:hypothetical protein
VVLCTLQIPVGSSGGAAALSLVAPITRCCRRRLEEYEANRRALPGAAPSPSNAEPRADAPPGQEPEAAAPSGEAHSRWRWFGLVAGVVPLVVLEMWLSATRGYSDIVRTVALPLLRPAVWMYTDPSHVREDEREVLRESQRLECGRGGATTLRRAMAKEHSGR